MRTIKQAAVLSWVVLFARIALVFAVFDLLFVPAEQVINYHGEKFVFLRVSDEYDTPFAPSLMEFFREEDALDRMKAFNASMHEEYDFLEIGVQNLAVIEEFPYKEQFRIDYGTDYYEENDDAQICLSSVQLDWTAYDTYSLEKMIESGRGFRKQDFVFSGGSVPVILGSEYKDVAARGDILQMEYLFQPLELKVIGFFEPATSMKIDGNLYEFDNTIVMPSFSMDGEPTEEEDRTFQEILYSTKNFGYILVKNGDSYTEYKNEIQRMDEKLGVCYSVNPSNLAENGNLSADSGYSLFGIFALCAAIVLLTAVYCLLLRERWKMSETKKKAYRMAGKELFAQIAVAVIGGVVEFLIYRHTYMLFGEDYLLFRESVVFAVVLSIVMALPVFPVLRRCEKKMLRSVDSD